MKQLTINYDKPWKKNREELVKKVLNPKIKKDNKK